MFILAKRTLSLPKTYVLPNTLTYRRFYIMSTSQIISAPSQETPHAGHKAVFLAGSTKGHNWRPDLTSSLANYPITFYDPARSDWDDTWREELSDTRWNEQVTWELKKQIGSDLVVVYFNPATQAPISLLEFGLAAKNPEKVVAVCPEGFWKRGNVELVSQRLGIEFLEDIDGLRGAILRKLSME